MKAARGEAIAHFNAHVMEPSDGCRDWPYAANPGGYGLVSIRRHNRLVHRVTCARWHGEPFPGADAAHSCGRRLCWAGEHLRWATRKENAADMVLHGTVRRGFGPLTADDVLAIRARYVPRVFTLRMLADEYGVDERSIHRIITRERWGWL
jgi:hypothetical protein